MRFLSLLCLSLFVVLPTASCEKDEAPIAQQEQPETVWKTIGTWSGHGNAQLETFPIERFTWRVRWETRNESPKGSGTFHVTANSGDSGRILADVVNTTGVDKGLSYVTELPHRYYLVVTSEGLDWTVTAEEPILP
jgi:hypothetical protein